MRKGKTAAQVAHAAVMFLTEQIRNPCGGLHQITDLKGQGLVRRDVWLNYKELSWCMDSFTKVVLGADSEEHLLELVEKGKAAGIKVHKMIDNGITAFNNELTLTCAAFGPDTSERLDVVTGGLRLL